MPKTISTNQATFSFSTLALWISATAITKDGIKEEDFFFPRQASLAFLDEDKEAVRSNFAEIEHYLQDTDWHGRAVYLDRYDERSNCWKYFVDGLTSVEFDKDEVAFIFEDGAKWRFGSAAMSRGYSFTPFFKHTIIEQARQELKEKADGAVAESLRKN